MAERLDVYGRYPELLAQRDDCYLDRIVLLCQQGRYAEAIHAAKIKRFHIYEGGEGNLTKQHAWMHVLYANELASAGKAAEAYQVYMNGVNMPKSYGEAKPGSIRKPTFSTIWALCWNLLEKPRKRQMPSRKPPSTRRPFPSCPCSGRWLCAS